MNQPIERRLSRRESAERLTSLGYRISARTLDQLAWKGGGPSFEKFGRRALYTESGLLAWAQCTGQPQHSTSTRHQAAASNEKRRRDVTRAGA